MDLIGPLPEIPCGNKYIATLTGYFSKWAEAAPLQNKSALGVAKFIYSVSDYKIIISVKVTEFVIKIFIEVITDIITDVFCIGHM